MSNWYEPATIKRKVYFAFRFKDIMRVNNVRQSGKVGFDQEGNPRDFYDRSIWESSSSTNPESLKRLMRDGVEHSSVVCVLNCTYTWESRWVKYEIARAVIDKKGLLTVHIAGLNHHARRAPDQNGVDPLSVMGVFTSREGSYYLYEKQWVMKDTMTFRREWKWYPYPDYTRPVSLPAYLVAPEPGYIRPLNTGTYQYDYVQHNGCANLGMWLDAAARQVNW